MLIRKKVLEYNFARISILRVSMYVLNIIWVLWNMQYFVNYLNGIRTSICLLLQVYNIATYRLQHCLEWVMQVYTSKLTPDSVVTYLLHDWARSLWLFCLVWHVRVMIKVQYTSTDS